MITIGWYLLKVIICSGILYGYYHLALRNKIFHQWNRFYLLASVVLALVFPIIKINILQQPVQENGTVIKVLQTINSGDDIVTEYSRHNGLQLNAESIIWSGYLLVSLFLLSVFVYTLSKIYRLKRKYPSAKMQDILFVTTNAKGTPFSFFKSIFWNNAIDPGSLQGQQILKHEIVHIREKHSCDKLFINLVLLICWINPVFWLIRRELAIIHEFIADKKSVEKSDTGAFAAMLLQTIYPGQTFSFTNNFFHSPLKRRLIMFAKNNNPRMTYISRLVALPLIALIFFAFTVKMKPLHPVNAYSGKRITVIIDAGHGGSDNGAVQNNIPEKDIDLAIAKDIKGLNKDENLNIILSREADDNINPHERVAFAEKNNANLFISIHANLDAEKTGKNGLEVYVANKDNPYLQKSKLLGSSIIDEFQNMPGIKVSNNLLQPRNGVWVLNAAPCPSVLIEAGYMDNNSDLKFMCGPENQKAIAQTILNGIEAYVTQNSTFNYRDIPVDTPPATKVKPLPDNVLYIIDGKASSVNEAKQIDAAHIKAITILKGNDAIQKYGDKAKNGVIIISTKEKVIAGNEGDQAIKPQPSLAENNMKKDTPATILNPDAPIRNPLYIIDGKESPNDALKNISPQSIESINVLRDEAALKKYGDKGKNGVVEITLKKESSSIPQDSKPEIVFTQTEQEAQFPGGHQAWIKYITGKIQDSAPVLTQKDFGTCNVKFIVNTDGTVTNVEPVNMKDTHLAVVAVNAIKEGPKWIPATQ
ncbi:MAG TPA: N-acetylmuramoyl-L-alanine amidase, partial [Chitinophagaceae bacterium]|nr:N-acetylmuramoyl-L-alanine amidase [Chitinophagaceae bacterium]